MVEAASDFFSTLKSKPLGYLSPKAEARSSEIEGSGIFAKEHISTGEVILVFSGRLLSSQQLMEICDNSESTFERTLERYTVQIEEDLFQLSVTNELEPAELINHSCEPNLGFRDQAMLVSMKDVQVGEELTFDYSLESTVLTMKCLCGTKTCRGLISGEDWKNEAFQQKYDGWFMPFLQRRINRLRVQKKAVEAASKPHPDVSTDGTGCVEPDFRPKVILEETAGPSLATQDK